MVNCPKGIKKYIRWQYPNENPNRIEADNYSSDKQIGKCPVEYHAFGTFISKRKADCNQLGYWRSSMRLNGADVSSYIPVEYGNRKTGIPLKNGRYANVYPLSKTDYDNRKLNGQSSLYTSYTSAGLPCGRYFSQLGSGYGFELTEVIRIDGLPDDCGGCEFTVYKNSVIVYQRTEDKCPEVEEYCDDNECPPDTCRCEHGSIVCCHDSITGEVVKQFRKSK